MIAAVATLAFLSTLWLLAVVGAYVWENSGSKIVAALKGQSQLTLATRPVRLRHQRYPAQRAQRVTVRQRAAA